MKEIIERAEKLGYKPYFFDNIWNYAEDEYIELCLIQKWLRDYNNIIMDVYLSNFFDKTFKYSIYNPETYSLVGYTLFEEALEEGIKKALEILEKYGRNNTILLHKHSNKKME